MKTIIFWMLAIALPYFGYAQTYTLESLHPLGAAGISRGDKYTLSQYVASPAAAKMTGGGYALVADCLGITLLQTPGAPLLSIRLVGQALAISWPANNFQNFVLEESVTLTPPLVWALSEATVLTEGNIRNTVIPPTFGKFYRLRKL